VIADQQLALVQLGWNAISVYQAALESDDPEIAVPAATKILEGTHLLNKRGFRPTLLSAVDWLEEKKKDREARLRMDTEAVVRDEPTPRMPPTQASQAESDDRSEERSS